MSDVVFVAEVGRVAGLGHLQRCLALAEGLLELGVASRFFGDDQEAASRVRAAGHLFEPLRTKLWSVEAAKEIAQGAARCRSGMLVIDGRDEHTPFLNELSEGGIPICIVDDNGGRGAGADYVVNGNAHAASLSYEGVPPDRCLLGPSFVLLPSPYWVAAHPPLLDPASRLLVTLGGGDPHNLWPRLLDALAEVPREVAMTVVIGPFVQETKRLSSALERFAARGVICQAPRSLGELVARADIVLTAAGQTLYELAALGRPAVAIQLAENQGPQLCAFVEEGAVVSVGRVSEPGIERTAVTRVIELMRQPARLQRMAAAGRHLVDGHGAHRVAAAVTAWAPDHAPDP